MRKFDGVCGDCDYLRPIGYSSDYPGSGLCGYYGEGGLTVDTTTRHPECPIDTEVLEAKRFRVRYRGETFYLVVSMKDGKPWEVFAEYPAKSKHSVQYMMAGWDCNTRFISIALKKCPLDKVVRQLRKSSRQKNDLPDIIADILEEWLDETD